MTIGKIDVTAAIQKVRDDLKKDKALSPALKASIELLITIINILLNQKNLNSRNSSKPPSQDPNRVNKTSKDRGIKRKKPGGQKGHKGSTLDPIAHPDEVKQIFIDKRTLPKGNYTHVGFQKHQVFDFKITRQVIEYQAEILEDETGVQWLASFPEGAKAVTQYGNGLKAHSVYMSQYQLIPGQRVADYFSNQMGIPLSKASVQNFNRLAFQKLEYFEEWAKKELLASPLNHADETGVNVDGKQFWFHLLSNKKVTLYQVDKKRGQEAMDRMGILPHFKGILCHDHWKPYYRYSCTHSLCGSHLLRELERAWEQDSQKWAKSLQELLTKINKKVQKTQRKKLSKKKCAYYQEKYRAILSEGEKECPLADENGKRGRTKQTTARNLLNRLRDFEDDTLRFMKESLVPFTNNLAENDLRMTKVQQKISGCFRSISGAKTFCLIRSYLLTCQKNNVDATTALKLLFEGKLPSFIT